MYLKGKLFFKNPKNKECIGFQDAGTCMQCLERDTSKVACKKLGAYLNKRDWNKIIGNGPLYQKDYKAREATESPDMQGNVRNVDKFGKFVGRKVA